MQLGRSSAILDETLPGTGLTMETQKIRFYYPFLPYKTFFPQIFYGFGVYIHHIQLNIFFGQ